MALQVALPLGSLLQRAGCKDVLVQIWQSGTGVSPVTYARKMLVPQLN